MSEEKTTRVLNVSDVAKDRVLLEVEVPAEKVARAIEHAYKDVASKVNIPGFRKGKAPKSLIEAKFGKDYFCHEAQHELLTPAFIIALNETNIKPLASELKDIFIEEGKPMVFKIEVQKEPVFDIRDTDGIAIKGAPVEVAEAEIEKKLNDMRERHSRLDVVTGRPAQNGDFVIVDFQGYIDNVASDGIKGSGAMFELGSKRAITGFEEGICGMNIGEEKDVMLRFPDDYKSEDYAGKEVRFHITLREVKVKIMPEPNDDFAKLLGEFNTIAELRDDIKEKLLESKKDHQKSHFKEQICDHLLEKNPQVEAPDAMIEHELDDIVKNYELQLLYMRMDLAHYLQSVGQTMEQFRARHREAAVKNVKITNILSSIGAHEKVKATEEEVKAKLQKLALSVGKTYADIRKRVEEEGNIVSIREEIVHAKVFDGLIAKAKVTIDPDFKCTHDHDHDHDHDHHE